MLLDRLYCVRKIQDPNEGSWLNVSQYSGKVDEWTLYVPRPTRAPACRGAACALSPVLAMPWETVRYPCHVWDVCVLCGVVTPTLCFKALGRAMSMAGTLT